MTTSTSTVTAPKSNAARNARRRKSMMRARQAPLMRLYEVEPEAAMIVDGACTVRGAYRRHDAVHGELSIGTSNPLTAPVSIHSAVGGDHDGPNPGDYLCAALAGCFETTLRIIADRYAVQLDELCVSARAHADVRGTLCVSSDVEVGFQRIELNIQLAAAGIPEPQLRMLVAGTEHCCVVYRTLQGGVPIDISVEIGASDR